MLNGAKAFETFGKVSTSFFSAISNTNAQLNALESDPTLSVEWAAFKAGVNTFVTTLLSLKVGVLVMGAASFVAGFVPVAAGIAIAGFASVVGGVFSYFAAKGATKFTDILFEGMESLGLNLGGIEDYSNSEVGLTITGSIGSDTITSTNHDDAIYLGSSFDLGNDFVIQKGGSDRVDGGFGTDTIDYRQLSSPIVVEILENPSDSQHTIRVGHSTGEDSLKNIEKVIGTQKPDWFIWNELDNITLYGANGDDMFALHGDRGSRKRHADGGNGQDTIHYYDPENNNNHGYIDLEKGEAYTKALVLGTKVTFENIENAIGSENRDTIIGSSGDNNIYTGSDQDSIVGSIGEDTIDGGTEKDVIDYQFVDVPVINFERTNIVLVGDDVQTVINVETIRGSQNSDVLTTKGSFNIAHGGAGNDILFGGGDASNLYGGTGIDVFNMAHNAHVKDAAAEDGAFWGYRLIGGVQMSWNESGLALPQPASAIVSAASTPMMHATLTSAAMFLRDLPMMLMYAYGMSESGQLLVHVGHNTGFHAVFDDYDYLEGTASITVFRAIPGKASVAQLKQFLELAFKSAGVEPKGTDPLVIDMGRDGIELSRAGAHNSV